VQDSLQLLPLDNFYIKYAICTVPVLLILSNKSSRFVLLKYCLLHCLFEYGEFGMELELFHKKSLEHGFRDLHEIGNWHIHKLTSLLW